MNVMTVQKALLDELRARGFGALPPVAAPVAPVAPVAPPIINVPQQAPPVINVPEQSPPIIQLPEMVVNVPRQIAPSAPDVIVELDELAPFLTEIAVAISTMAKALVKLERRQVELLELLNRPAPTPAPPPAPPAPPPRTIEVITLGEKTIVREIPNG